MAHLHIMDIGKNAMTGLITLEARILDMAPDGSPVAGAVERYHVEALDIARNYEGQVELWLQKVGGEMLIRHRLRTAAHDGADHWKGRSMEIPEI